MCGIRPFCRKKEERMSVLTRPSKGIAMYIC